MPKEKLSIINNKEFYYYISYFMTMALLPRFLVSNAVMQRIFMGKNERQIKTKFLFAALFEPFFISSLLIIGLSIIILFPNLKTQDILFYTLNNVLDNSIIKGFIISGILAILMSTADSCVHSYGLMFYNDVLPKKIKTSYDTIFLVKLSTVIIGFLSVFVATKITIGYNFLNLLLIRYKFSISVLAFPIFIGIMGLKTDKRSFYFGAISAVIYLIISEYYFPKFLNSFSILIATILNGIIFILSHIIINKNIIFINRKNI
ncbi:MAG: hypothetical protein GY830_05590 [Bacteroidetes bacterium]|nr:hypothetical protein [Bacteroidota bacterium]